MAPPGFNVSMFWEKSPTDLSSCNECYETIYGTMFYPVIELEDDGTIESTTFNKLPEIKFCKSCFTDLGGKLSNP